MAVRKYRFIDKYIVNAECIAPIHIGSASGEKDEVLVHPVTDVPFIQSSSIAGLMKSASERINGKEITDKLFGSSDIPDNANASEYGSMVRISDGTFVLNTVKLELRPRVKINQETGTVSAAVVKGSGASAGQKFEIESIGTGAEFSYSVYLYNNELKNALESVFAELATQKMQFGGQKSNGQGYIALNSLKHKTFDLKDDSDRKKWVKEELLSDSEYDELTGTLQESTEGTVAYTITAKGETEGSLLVKSLSAVYSQSGDNLDAVNIQNAKNEYIVPGSSLKGVLRNYTGQIAKRIGKEYLIDRIYGKSGATSDSCSAGCVSVWDTVVGKERDNEKNPIQYHIHIDKFTGGVFEQELFNTQDVSGRTDFRINITRSPYAVQACGLIILALRDLNAGLMSIGSGYSIGKGFMKLESIEIQNCPNGMAVIDFRKDTIDDTDGIITNALMALKDSSEKEEL